MGVQEQTEGCPREVIVAAMERGPGAGRYALPSLTGYNGHDSTKYRAPYYSFGLQRKEHNYSVGPGPGYNVRDLTRRGKTSAPEYSAGIRLKPLTAFRTPGPGTYAPEGYRGKHTPEFSFGNRTEIRRKDHTPGPNRYAIPSSIGNKVPNLPFAPKALVFGKGRPMKFHRHPGPAHYAVPHPNVYKPMAPVYTLGEKTALVTDKVRKPGPGAHSIEKCFNAWPSAPKFPFGIRHSEYAPPLILPQDNLGCD